MPYCAVSVIARDRSRRIHIPMRESDAAAQQRVAADRFAREIVAILKSSYAARSRQLNPGRWAALDNSVPKTICLSVVLTIKYHGSKLYTRAPLTGIAMNDKPVTLTLPFELYPAQGRELLGRVSGDNCRHGYGLRFIKLTKQTCCAYCNVDLVMVYETWL